MKIVMVASECNPFCKTGGLADVILALSRELVKQGDEVTIFIPYYKKVKDKHIGSKFVRYDYVDMSWRHQYIGTSEVEVDGIKFYLIENDQYFGRDNLYGYGDDGERFAFFSLAVQKVMNEIGLYPDVVHVHDWQAGMLPTLMKYRPLNTKRCHFMLTIHNPAFKGYLDKYALGDLYNLPDYLFDEGAVRLDNMVSTLKAAISHVDKITTVSPTHRNELLTVELSQGLSSILELRKHDFVGIVNGVDDIEFDPEKDPSIAANFNAKNFKENKNVCKKAILSEFGLTNKDAPTFGLVSRLTWQKGINLIVDNINYMLSKGANLVFLGSGEKELENALLSYKEKFPEQVAIYVGYSDSLAHKIYAGSDFFLMPSLFEPCGIGQIIAQRYGTLPIVRETGGLADTVHNEVDGFSFKDYSAYALRTTLDRVFKYYYEDSDSLDKMVVNALSLDNSWKDSATIYRGIYKEIVEK